MAEQATPEDWSKSARRWDVGAALAAVLAIGLAAWLGGQFGEWHVALHASTVDKVRFDRPSDILLVLDVLLVACYVACGVALHGATRTRAEALHGIDVARFRPLADRLRRWSKGGLGYVVLAGIADLVENALLGFWVDGVDAAGSWVLVLLQAATWLKWLALGAAAVTLLVTWATARLRVYDLRPDPASGGALGQWQAGRAADPNEWAPPADGKRIGVSLSGGGIRSASFSLGALQAVARSTVGPIRYVTSVSGGGYMAAAWASLTKCNGARPERPFRPRSPEERWVRHHTNYLVSSGGVVLGSVLTLLGGLLMNVLLVFVLLEAVAHPTGWVLGAAHPELRAETPIVEIRSQPSYEVVPGELNDVDVAVADDCDDCVPRRRRAKAYEVRLQPTPRKDECESEDKVARTRRPDIAAVKDVDEAPKLRCDLALTVTPGIVAEGTEGLVVLRQPVVAFVDGSPADVVDHLRIAQQPTIDVEALPEDSRAAPTSLPDTLDADLVDVETQPRLEQLTGTRGRDPLSFPAWMSVVLGVLIVAVVVTHALDPILQAKLTTRHVLSQAMAKLLALALLVLLVLPVVVDQLPTWVAALPGYDDTSIGWQAIGAFLVTAVPLLLRFRGSIGKHPALRRFRGRGLVLDALLGIVVLAVFAATFVGLADLAAANGIGGRLAGVHERWMGAIPDSTRWGIAVGAFLAALAFPIASHTWSLYSVYHSGLASAYFLKAEPEGSKDTRGTQRYHVERLTGEERRRWAWDPPKLPINLFGLNALVPGPNLRSLSTGHERSSDVDAIGEWVVCTTVNVRGAGEAAPGRAAGSFTFSSSWVGGPEVGWMPTADYLAKLSTGRAHSVSVPATTTISGAAFSPAMGKDSKSWQGRLLALGNLRLGVWVPNPMVIERRPLRKRGFGWFRKPSVGWYLRELFGWFDRTAPYVYLTDGGHWENLGLVELLRRRCTEVWMVSAAGDGSHSFETLAQAIALAREELGVEFDLELESLRAPAKAADGGRRLVRDAGATPTAKDGAVAGTFWYPDGVKGRIHVIEAALLGDLPWDVHAYAEANDDFPDIPTGYQLMDHRDFEAYRMLGYVQTARALHGAGHWPTGAPSAEDTARPVTMPPTRARRGRSFRRRAASFTRRLWRRTLRTRADRR